MMPRPTSWEAHSDARTATLSAPSIFNSGPKIGPTNMLSTSSAVLAIPVDAIALAAKGPPPAASQVVINMYNVRRPTWLAPPVTIRSMNSGVPKGNRSIFATGSRSPRDGSSRRGMVSGSPVRAQRSSVAGFGAPRQHMGSLSSLKAGTTRCVPRRWGHEPGRGPAKTVRDQPSQSGMSTQRLADPVGAAGAKSFLKQAAGQQIGGYQDAGGIVAPGVGARDCQLRSVGGRKAQPHPRCDQRGRCGRGNVEVGT